MALAGKDMAYLTGLLRSRRPPPVPEKLSTSPEHESSFISWITFQWISPVLRVSRRRPLTAMDIWSVHRSQAARQLSESLLGKLGTRHVHASRSAVLWALYGTFRQHFVAGGCWHVVANCLQILSPLVVKYLILFVGNTRSRDADTAKDSGLAYGFGLIIVIVFMQVVQSLAIHHYTYRGMIAGAEVRSALTAVIFRKAMRSSGHLTMTKETRTASLESTKGFLQFVSAGRASHSAHANQQEWSAGRTINLINTDVYRIEQAIRVCNNV